jgi:L-ascorbate metabolism protein UlaG (beta-lactamase superfamily)
MRLTIFAALLAICSATSVLPQATAPQVPTKPAAHAPDTFQTTSGVVTIAPIRHASLLISAGGLNIYIDPAQGKFDGLPPADLILITDIHDDHMAPAIIDKVKKQGTLIFAPKAVAEKTHVDTVMANGDTQKWRDWTIEAVPAYNRIRGPEAGQVYHDKGRGNGYVLTYGGKRFYISGDTEDIPEMAALKNIDVAFLCMNLPYTMTPEEAALAVQRFHPKIVYPYHCKGTNVNAFVSYTKGSGAEIRVRDWYPKT